MNSKNYFSYNKVNGNKFGLKAIRKAVLIFDQSQLLKGNLLKCENTFSLVCVY